MRIGILTFHAQQNYGGVLQAWALQTAIEKLGYEAVVIDRKLSANDHNLKGPGFSWPLIDILWYVLRCFLGIANKGLWTRGKKSKEFISRFLHLTEYSFLDWSEAPRDLGLDAIVVGSDQVWHIGKKWGDPRPYFLMGAPKEIPAISYAASFGMSTIPNNDVSLYKEGLSRFCQISVREAEGKRLVESVGLRSEHVVDPTLLVAPEVWIKTFTDEKERRQSGKTLVFYLFETIGAADLLEIVERASRTGWKLAFLHNRYLVKIPRNLDAVHAVFRLHKDSYKDVVTFADTADPGDFVKYFSRADAIVTDSFHGLMFAILFRKNVRIVAPRTADRKVMFARIEEFSRNASGEVKVDSVLKAVESIISGEIAVVPLESQRSSIDRSQDWLAKHLHEISLLREVRDGKQRN